MLALAFASALTSVALLQARMVFLWAQALLQPRDSPQGEIQIVSPTSR
jgi:hypothetical protein